MKKKNLENTLQGGALFSTINNKNGKKYVNGHKSV